MSLPSQDDDSTSAPSRNSIIKGDKSYGGGGLGIFDKIYNYLNRQTKEEKDSQERKQREESRLLSGGSLLTAQKFQYKTMNTAGNDELLKKYMPQSHGQEGRNDALIKKFQNYQKMDEIQRLNMPFQPGLNRFSVGAQGPLTNSRFTP